MIQSHDSAAVRLERISMFIVTLLVRLLRYSSSFLQVGPKSSILLRSRTSLGWNIYISS